MNINLNKLKDLSPGESVSYAGAVTYDTVNVIIRLIRDSVHFPAVRSVATDILYGIEEKNWFAEIEAIYDFAKTNMRYIQDPMDVEYVQTPEKILKDIRIRGQASGDCDDHVVFLGSLLHNAGYNTRIVIIQSPWNATGEFNHIYLYVNVPYTNNWISLDPTAKDKPIGWEADYIKRKIFVV